MMIAVDETALWTAIEALDSALEMLEETMEGDEDERSMFDTYSEARDTIMNAIKEQQRA